MEILKVGVDGLIYFLLIFRYFILLPESSLARGEDFKVYLRYFSLLLVNMYW
jgi:hypothetical protein